MRRDELPADVLERRAVVYVRQSTGAQVHDNLESQRRQYELTDVARTYQADSTREGDATQDARARIPEAHRSVVGETMDHDRDLPKVTPAVERNSLFCAPYAHVSLHALGARAGANLEAPSLSPLGEYD